MYVLTCTKCKLTGWLQVLVERGVPDLLSRWSAVLPVQPWPHRVPGRSAAGWTGAARIHEEGRLQGTPDDDCKGCNLGCQTINITNIEVNDNSHFEIIDPPLHFLTHCKHAFLIKFDQSSLKNLKITMIPFLYYVMFKGKYTCRILSIYKDNPLSSLDILQRFRH